MNKYKLAIFDMDGTILYTLQDLTDAMNYGLTENGMPARTIDEICRFIGDGVKMLTHRSVPEGTEPLREQKVFDKFTEFYKVHCNDHTVPYEGIIPLLQELRKRGVMTAVVSNKANYAVQDLAKRNFDGLFDAVEGERPPYERKPSADLCNLVLSELQVEAGDAVYIGDTEVDMKTAENSGMDCITVDWGFRGHKKLVELGADKIADLPADILKMLCC